MGRIINPFIVTGKIKEEYFCDRVNETAKLIKTVTNGNNLVIISPRRMGKTGLIQSRGLYENNWNYRRNRSRKKYRL